MTTSIKRQQRIIHIISYIVLVLTTATIVYPVLYMVLGAFTTQDRFLESVLFPLPNTLNLDLFAKAFRVGMGNAYRVTLTLVGYHCVVTVLVSLLAGYVFSKLRFKGRDVVFSFFLAGMVMPQILMMIPAYLLHARFPLVGGNNLLGVGGSGFINKPSIYFISGLVPIFAIFLIKQSYDMLPREYEEAALMDGAGFLTIIFRIYVPMLKPAIVAIVVVTAFNWWNQYLWPLMTMGGRSDWHPVALAANNLPSLVEADLGTFNVHYPSTLLKAFLVSFPPAALYLILQRYFVQGLASSGIKG
jgi:multiple sugar transport system permease protein